MKKKLAYTGRFLRIVLGGQFDVGPSGGARSPRPRRLRSRNSSFEPLESRTLLSVPPWTGGSTPVSSFSSGTSDYTEVASPVAGALASIAGTANGTPLAQDVSATAQPGASVGLPMLANDHTIASEPLALSGLTSATNEIPAPFWRKMDDVPTYAPDWYPNQGPVTHEVFYNGSMTASENGDALEAVLENLSAGDHVRIHAGTYLVDSWLNITAFGTASQPIVIERAPGEQVVITRSDAAKNVVDFADAKYVIMQGLVLKGGSTGLKLYSVDHFMFYDSEIYDTAGNAIAANSADTSYLYFVDNNIHDTGGHGEGLYLGANDGTHVTHDTYVVGNYIHDLNAPDVEQGDGIEVKDQSYAVTMKYNYIENTNYPGIVVYGTGHGAADRNLIEENVVLHSDDNAIQVGSEAIVRNNLVVTDRQAFYSKPATSNPKYLSVVNNTFISAATAVKVYGWDATDAVDIVFANNALYSATGEYVPTGMGNATVAANVFVQDLGAAFVNLTLDGSNLNATPRTQSVLVGGAEPRYLPILDLSGRSRVTGADVGAVDYREDYPEPGDNLKAYDFGTFGSPLKTGYERVFAGTSYSPELGYGWQSGTIFDRDRGLGTDRDRDFSQTRDGVFLVDVPNGSYFVTVSMWDAWTLHDEMELSLEDEVVDTVSTGPPQPILRTYRVDVTDGQLTVGVRNAGGIDPFAVINALEIAEAPVAPTEAYFDFGTADSPVESGHTPVTSASLYTMAAGFGWQSGTIFDRDRGLGTDRDRDFSQTRDGVFLVDVPNGSYLVTVSMWDAWTMHDEMELSLEGQVVDTVSTGPPQPVLRTYRVDVTDGQLTVGVRNAGGIDPFAVINALEIVEAPVAPSEAYFDFGTADSPVEPGYTPVTSASLYTMAAGYGWQSGTIIDRDREIGTDLDRDFSQTRDGLFLVDLANGTYQITVTMADPVFYHNEMELTFEETVVDTVTIGTESPVTRMYTVDVSDGQLTFRLRNAGGDDPFAIVNSLAIEPVVVLGALAPLAASTASVPSPLTADGAQLPPVDAAALDYVGRMYSPASDGRGELLERPAGAADRSVSAPSLPPAATTAVPIAIAAAKSDVKILDDLFLGGGDETSFPHNSASGDLLELLARHVRTIDARSTAAGTGPKAVASHSDDLSFL